MDCTIPSHNVKVFSSWVVTLGKIGSSDMYLEFDPLQGLTLRTLNDAKSAYAKVTFDPTFFEACRAPAVGGNDNGGEDEMLYTCRLSIRTLYSVLRTSRKGLQSLRMRTNTYSNSTNASSADTNGNNKKEQISLEFRLSGNYSIFHRLAVQSCHHSIPAAVIQKEGCSEIIMAPKLLHSMVEPLKRSNQVALHVTQQVISATSFHTQTTHQFKSETTLSCDDLQDFYFKDDRNNLDDDNDMPPNVNEEVTLVFGLKELKAMLQFCNRGASDTNSGLAVILFFHWGGKPLVVETEGDAFTAELVLATLDYKLLAQASTSITTEGATNNNMTTPQNTSRQQNQ